MTTVGFYLENYAPGGLERLLFDLLASYSSAEHTTVLFYAGDRTFPERLKPESISPSRLVWVPVHTTKRVEEWVWSRHPPRWIWKAFLGLIDLVRWLFAALNIAICRRALSANPVQTLHIINGGYPASRSCLSAVVAARQSGVSKIVLTVTASPQPRRWPLLERYFDHRVNAACHYLVSNCDYLTCLMKTQRGFSDSKLKTIHGGIPRLPPPSQQDVDAFCQQWSITRPLIGSVAVLQYHKGHRFLLRALQTLERDVPGLCCLIVGDGPEREGLQKMVHDLGLTGQVRFTGQLAHFRTVMAVMDIFVHPSLEEGFPYVILEAMSLGKPIVATRVAGVPEQIIDGESGLLVRPGDAEELSGALRRLLSDPAHTQEMGHRAKERASLFTLDGMLKKFRAL